MPTEKPAQPLIEPTFGEKLETWYDRNGNWLNILMIVILAGVIGYKVYGWMQTRNVASANTAYGLAVYQLQTAQQNPDEKQKIDQLQGAITAAQQVVDEHSDQFVGRQAQLVIGNAQYMIASSDPEQGVKGLERARDSYRAYIDMANTNTEKAAGYIALGNVLENLSFIQSSQQVLQEAETAYTEALSASQGTNLGAEAKLALARTKAGRSAEASQVEAAKLFQEVAASRDVRLVSDAELEATKPIELEGGQTLSADEVKDIKNLAAWSQRQLAQDALAQLK